MSWTVSWNLRGPFDCVGSILFLKCLKHLLPIKTLDTLIRYDPCSPEAASLLQWFSLRAILPTPGDIWQCLEIFSFITNGEVPLVAILVGRKQGCYHWTSCMHRTAPKPRIIQTKMSTVPQARKARQSFILSFNNYLLNTLCAKDYSESQGLQRIDKILCLKVLFI